MNQIIVALGLHLCDGLPKISWNRDAVILKDKMIISKIAIEFRIWVSNYIRKTVWYEYSTVS